MSKINTLNNLTQHFLYYELENEEILLNEGGN